MNQAKQPSLDEDLKPRFRWRWGEHGIYLGVCSVIGLLVLALHVLPLSNRRAFRPEDFAFVAVRYMSAATATPPQDEPFHDPRLVRPLAHQASDRPSKPAP